MRGAAVSNPSPRCHPHQPSFLNKGVRVRQPLKSLPADAEALSQSYNRTMKDAMGWEGRPYEYDYSRGLYYHQIIPGLYCGSQPRHAHDIAELKSDLGLSTIISLQQDKDMEHWGVVPEEIRSKCSQLGVNLVRRPVQDFDPDSLRKVLPSAVHALHDAISLPQSRVYVHCTAGLGRAPGTIIAYLYWFCGMDLHQAYDKLTSIRPCGPKKEAIRGATFDLLSGYPMNEFDRQPNWAFTSLDDENRRLLQSRVLQR